MKHAIRLSSFAGNPVPGDLALYRLTDERDVQSCHVYMEAQVFTPDSQRFVLHRSAHPHGSAWNDPAHRYLLCDLADGGSLSPLTEETGATAPCVSPDGSTFYYFVNEIPEKGRIRFRKVDLATGRRDEIAVLDLPGGPSPAFYPLSTISSDGRHIAIATSLTLPEFHPWLDNALWVFDTATGESRLALRGLDFCNLHPQYSRNPARPRAIMVQHNHGSRHLALPAGNGGGYLPLGHVASLDAESGRRVRAVRAGANPDAANTGYGIDLHIVEDDGTCWRTLPVGRDGAEFCQGHQCWVGRTDRAIASTLIFQTPSTAHQELVEADWLDGAVHCGNRTAGGACSVISRGVTPPHFLHFATDAAGRRIVSDYEADTGEWHLYAGELGAFGEPASLRMILNMGPRAASPWHPHPFLSPDGRWAFFNSSASGRLQAYAVALEP